MSHAVSPALSSSPPPIVVDPRGAQGPAPHDAGADPLPDDFFEPQSEHVLPEIPERRHGRVQDNFWDHPDAMREPLAGLQSPAASARQAASVFSSLQRVEERWGTPLEREACHRMQTGVAVLRAFALPGSFKHLEATRSPTGRFVYFLVDGGKDCGKRLARMDLSNTQGQPLGVVHGAQLGNSPEALTLAHNLTDLPPIELDDPSHPLDAPIEVLDFWLSDATEPGAKLLGVTFMRAKGDDEPYPSTLIVGRPAAALEQERASRSLYERRKGGLMHVTWRCLTRNNRFAAPHTLGYFFQPSVRTSKAALKAHHQISPSEVFLLIAEDGAPKLQKSPQIAGLCGNEVYAFVRSGTEIFSAQTSRVVQQNSAGDASAERPSRPSVQQQLFDSPLASLDLPWLAHGVAQNLLPHGAQALSAVSLSDAGRVIALGYDDRLIIYRIAASRRLKLEVVFDSTAAKALKSQNIFPIDVRITSLYLSGNGELLLANAKGKFKAGKERQVEGQHGICLALRSARSLFDIGDTPKVACVFESSPEDSQRRNRKLVWLRDGEQIFIGQPHQLSVMAFSRPQFLSKPPPSPFAFFAPLEVVMSSPPLDVPPNFDGEIFSLGWSRSVALVGHGGKLFQLPVVGAPLAKQRTHMTGGKGSCIHIGDHHGQTQFVVTPSALKAIANRPKLKKKLCELFIEQLWGDVDGSRLYVQINRPNFSMPGAWQRCLLSYDFAPQRAQCEGFGPLNGFVPPISTFQSGCVFDQATGQWVARLIVDKYFLAPLGVLQVQPDVYFDPVEAEFGDSIVPLGAETFEDVSDDATSDD